MALEVMNVSKSFGTKTAVKNLTFTVPQGQVFGLLGLNGAGKSTTIRMILDILTPDTGAVHWQGRPTRDQLYGTFGFLPEERGLYQKMKVLSQLVLSARLQGMSKSAAITSAKQWLERFDITSYEQSLIGDLSKGNQQKVQFINAVVHHPALVILDEPFSGLDPVNTSLFKDVFRELVDSGKTVVFSSHRLDHVEELSDAVGMIHQSTLVISGRVTDILEAQAPQWLRIGAPQAALEALLPAAAIVRTHRGLHDVALSQVDPQQLLAACVTAGVALHHFELVRPTLQDIFLEKVGRPA